MKKRTIKRRKGKGKNNYFTMDTHDAIRDFQNAPQITEKHEIYVVKILPAFNKLAENLIFIQKESKD